MNFVLEKNECPRLYLGIEHRDSYLDVVAEGNKESYRSIIDFLYDIYIDQYNQVIKDIQEMILKKRNEDFYKKYEVLEQFKKL